MARIRALRSPSVTPRKRSLRRTVDNSLSDPTASSDPRSARSRASRSARAGRMIVPSTLTILAICAGLTAVRSADVGQVDLAMGLLVLAAVFDGLDGRVARLMDASTKIGAEVDSLADAINFGVAPALIVYAVVLRDASSSAAQDFGWILALLY
ncbi:MAG: CDP-alcohol phosphatidyltransferase family protein, partial [Gordonia sp. (in: high G+C Gram-positive bacteria)]